MESHDLVSRNDIFHNLHCATLFTFTRSPQITASCTRLSSLQLALTDAYFMNTIQQEIKPASTELGYRRPNMCG